MTELSANAKSYLIKMCNLYNQCGTTSFFTEDISFSERNNLFFEELDSAGYVVFQNSIAPNVRLTPKAIAYAKTLA